MHHLSNPWLCNIRLPLLDCFYTPVIYENLCSLRMFYVVKDTVFWAVVAHILAEIYRHFKLAPVSSVQILSLRLRKYIFPTPSINFYRPYEVTSQKTAFFISKTCTLSCVTSLVSTFCFSTQNWSCRCGMLVMSEFVRSNFCKLYFYNLIKHFTISSFVISCFMFQL